MDSNLVISLDFELFWGVLDSKTVRNYGSNILGVHQAIPALLDLFDKYDVKATFAIVGFLFYSNRSDLTSAWPERKPPYSNPRLSPYGYPFDSSQYFFAPNLVEAIRRRPQHEIATHTFSHYYCGEPGPTLDDFRADLSAALTAGKLQCVNQSSIVFPRNQIHPGCLSICHQMGIRAYRGNQTSWIYRTSNRSIAGRLLRQLDSYLNLSGHNHYLTESILDPSGLINIPASAFFRPHSPSLPWLDGLQRRRICRALEDAARRGRTYHLWWHPHNFGTHLDRNIANLEAILKHYQELHRSHKMCSRTMKELTELV